MLILELLCVTLLLITSRITREQTLSVSLQTWGGHHQFRALDRLGGNGCVDASLCVYPPSPALQKPLLADLTRVCVVFRFHAAYIYISPFPPVIVMLFEDIMLLLLRAYFTLTARFAGTGTVLEIDCFVLLATNSLPAAHPLHHTRYLRGGESLNNDNFVVVVGVGHGRNHQPVPTSPYPFFGHHAISELMCITDEGECDASTILEHSKKSK